MHQMCHKPALELVNLQSEPRRTICPSVNRRIRSNSIASFFLIAPFWLWRRACFSVEGLNTSKKRITTLSQCGISKVAEQRLRKYEQGSGLKLDS
jgi:hypothetical protein